MKGLNLVQLMGNLGTEPEMKFTSTGTAVTTFSMATSRKYKDDNGNTKEDVTWHKVIVWDKLAQLCNESLDKGSPVYVQGRINNRSWEDQQHVRHYVTEIIAEEVIFLDKKMATHGGVPAEVPAHPASSPAAGPLEAPSSAKQVEEPAELPF